MCWFFDPPSGPDVRKKSQKEADKFGDQVLVISSFVRPPLSAFFVQFLGGIKADQKDIGQGGCRIS